MDPTHRPYDLLTALLDELAGDQAAPRRSTVARLASLVLPVATKLERVSAGADSVTATLASLGERAREVGCADWLQRAIAQESAASDGDGRLLLHRLLYAALVTIRVEAHAVHDDHAFCLADAFHTLPLRLSTGDWAASSDDGLVSALRERAASRGCGAAVDRIVAAATSGVSR